MAVSGLTRMPVVDRDDPTHVLSVIVLRDLLQARTRSMRDERERERTLRVRALPRITRRPQTTT